MSHAKPAHAPMDQFRIANGQLLIGGAPLADVVAQAGNTPVFLYDRDVIDRRVTALRRALPPQIELHYAIKANPFPPVVRHLAGLVDGLDVASAGELALALEHGGHASTMSFAGPGKRLPELEAAVTAGVLINVESAGEAKRLADVSGRIGKAARVAVRVNPDFELKSSGMKMGGGARPFGVDAEEVPTLLRDMGRLGLAFEGFHIFAGSQNLRPDAIIEAQKLSYALALRLASDAPAAVQSLNLGGGFGIPYFPGEKRLELEAIGEALGTIVSDAQTHMPEAKVILELGRYLVGEAGIYVTRVVDRKRSRGRTYLVVDGGLHHHLAASGNFGQVIRKNYPVSVFPARGGADSEPRTEVVTIVGPLCTPLDILADETQIAHEATEGDFVVVFQSGAYGATASPARFLGHPQAVEMLV